MSEPPSDDRSDLNLFVRDDCLDVWNRVTLLVYWRYGHLAERGVDLEGIIIDVIIEEAGGESKRNWPADVPLVVFLYQSCRSRLGHMLEREKRLGYLDESAEEISEEDASALFKNPTRGARPRRREEDSKEDFSPHMPHARKPPHNPGPGKAHRKVESAELRQKILEAVGDDELVRRIAREWMDEPNMKPGGLAERLDVPIKQVRYAVKRLKRRLSKLRKEYGHE